MATPISDPTNAGFNSYGDLDGADTFYEAAPLSDYLEWDSFSDDVKSRSLLTATRNLDNYFVFIGEREDAEQNLNWPRTGISIDGADSEAAIIPTAIKNACYEWARILGSEITSANPELDKLAQTVSQVKIGSMELSLRNNGAKTPDDVPESVRRLVDRYGKLESTALQGLVQGRIKRV